MSSSPETSSPGFTIALFIEMAVAAVLLSVVKAKQTFLLFCKILSE